MKKRMKQIVVPRTMMVHRKGRDIHARDVSRVQMHIARIPAAAGGILSSKFCGSPAKPRVVMTVGKYQVKAYEARFMSVWSRRKAQTLGLLNATQASLLFQLGSPVAGAFGGSRASRNCCSRGVSQDRERGDLGKSGKMK